MVEATASAGSNGEFANVGEIPAHVMNDEVKEYDADLEDIFFVIPSGDYQRIVF